ncbi:MAG: endonuclease domain-containing protein [Oscillospiraceae bacterium]|nr:endonuclease domain-containing protein [Oscillospiraceae bacterium]
MQHNRKLTTRAQTLWRNMTKEERRLWYEYLHNYPQRFRRQVTVGNYILDFYCAAAKLAVELDGSQHYEPKEQNYDAMRAAYLNRIGIMVLRFSNLDVLRNLRGVCQMIDMTVAQRLGDLSRP